MFARATRPPPPSGRAPRSIMNRMASRNLRPAVILFGFLACLWALVWGASTFRDISYDQRVLSSFVIFDIIIGSLFMAVAAIEAYGIFAAVKARIGLVKIYAYLSLAAALLVIGIEIINLVLHFSFKSQRIQICRDELRGTMRTVDTGFGSDFRRITRPLTDGEAQDICDSAWNKETFQNVAWLLVAAILGLLFSALTFAYLRQLMDPSLQRSQAPSAAYQMHAARNPYQTNVNIPGYNPYQSQSYGNYVPPYDNAKPPGYAPGPGYGGYGQEDEKLGPIVGRNSGDAPSSTGHTNPFRDPDQSQTYLPQAGAPPPGLETYAQNLGHGRVKDEGFDSAALDAAMKNSQVETKGPGRNDEGAAGSSSK